MHRSFGKAFHIQNFFQRDAFPHRRFYTQKSLHTDAFTHRRFIQTQKVTTTEASTDRGFHTQRLFHTQTLFHTYEKTLFRWCSSKGSQGRPFWPWNECDLNRKFYLRKGCAGRNNIAMLCLFFLIDRLFLESVDVSSLPTGPRLGLKRKREEGQKKREMRERKKEKRETREERGKRAKRKKKLVCKDVSGKCDDV